VSDLEAGDRRLEPDVLLPFFGLWQNLEPDGVLRANIERIHVAAGPAGLFAVGDIVTYRGKLKLLLSGFAEAAATHAIFPLVHRAKPCTLEHSSTKGIPAAS
jgi:thioredoxin reductase (NADPH)